VQPFWGNLAAALEAIAVIALLNRTKCRIYLFQRLCLQLDQRESDVVLDVYLGALGSVEDTPVTNSLTSDVANPAVKFVSKFRASVLQNRPEVIKPARLCCRCRRSLPHDCLPVLLRDASDAFGSPSVVSDSPDTVWR
jgi:hypothetical protein